MAIRFFNDQDVFGDATIEGILQVGPIGSGLKVDNSSNDYNVGIGIASPSAKLHVAGKTVIQTSGTATAHSDTDLLIANSTAASSTSQIQILSGVSGSSNLYFSDTAAYSVGGIQYNHTDNKMTLRVAAGSKMTILSSGNVGIGTTSPAQKLHINGNFLLENNNEIRQKDSGGTQRTIIELDSSNDLNIGGSYAGALKFIGGGSYTEVMRIHDNGNVGIGTINPPYKLTVAGDTYVFNANLHLNSGYGIVNAGNTSHKIGFPSLGNFAFENVNVGIGTTSPDSKLEVDMNDASGNRLGFVGDGSTTGAALWTNWTTGASYLDFRLGGTTDTYTKMRIDSSGKVGIGTTNPGYKLEISDDTDTTVNLLRLRNADSLYSQTWDFQLDTGKHLVVTGGSGSGGIVLKPGSAGLNVTSTSAAQIFLNSATGNDSVLNFRENSSQKGKIGYDTSLSGIALVAGSGAFSSADMVVLDSGNVGIGTTSPNSKLHIKQSADSIDGGLTWESVDGTQEWSIDANNAGNFRIYKGTTAVARFDSSGNLGIGTTSPGVKLDVAGQIRASSGLEISGGNINLVDNSRIRLGSSADFQIYHDGSNSYITDTGTGDLYIRGSNSVYIGNSAGTKTYISGTDGGATKLYYNGAGAQQKLETTTTGVSVTGTATATTFLGDLNGTINTATTAVTKANATNDTTVATTAFVQNLIGTIPAGLVFQGTWDAATNTPTLTSGSGTTGHFYIVSTDGSTNLDGITDWKVGDWAVFVEQGATDAWEKVDNSSVLDGSGTGQKVALWSGSGTSNTLTDAPITVSGNNVGIGTTSPSQALEVNGNIKISNTYKQYLLQSHNTYGNLLLQQSGAATIPLTVNSANLGIGVGNINLQSALNVNGGIAAGSYYNTAAPANGMIISGNVGIGTTSPQAKLEVASGDLIINNSGGKIDFRNGSGSSRYFLELANSNADLQINDRTGAGSVSMTIQSGGNVGIGTTNPSQKLHVVGKGLFTDDIQLTQTSPRIDYGNTTTAGSLRFWSTNAGGEKMRITSAGSVGIGTTNPESTSQLHIYKGTAAAKITLETTDSYESLLNFSAATNEYSVGFNKADNTFRISNANSLSSNVRMAINNAGNVGIGTTNPTAKLHSVTTTAGDSALKLQKGTSSEFDFQCGIAGVTGDALVIKDTTLSYDYLTLRSGNVGIGTTNPSQKLEVAGVIRTIGGSNNGKYSQINVNDSFAYYTTNASIIYMNQQLQVDTGLIGSYNEPLQLRTSGTTRMYINDSSGNVGIGTTSPGAKLHVEGTVKAGDSSTGISLGIQSTDEYRINGIDTAGAGWNSLHLRADGTDGLFIQKDTNNVGIGTTSPNSGMKLEVVGNIRTNVSNGKGFAITGTTGVTSGLVRSDGTGVALRTSDTDRVTVDLNGNVGIGTANPASKLHLSDTAVILTTTSTNGVSGFIHNVIGGATALYRLQNNGSERIRITSAGNVGIGTTSPSQKLDVAGNISLRHTTEDAVKFGSAGDLYGTSSANSVKLQKPGRSQYFLFGTQTGYFQVSDGTNNILLRAESTPEVNIYNTGALNYTQHSATNNNNGNVLTWSNSTSGNGERGRVSIVGDLRLDDYSSGSAVNVVNIENNGDAYFSGNVGIGTTDPGTKLEVVDPVVNGAQATFGYNSSDYYLSVGYNRVLSNLTGTTDFRVGTSTANHMSLLTDNIQRLTIEHTTGNIGIGTTSPDVKLEIVGSNALRIHDGTDQGSIFFRGDRDDVYIKESNYQLLFGSPSGMVFELDTNNNDSDYFNVTHRNNSRLYINGASGNVGIGTTNPSQKLQVDGNARVTGAYYDSNNSPGTSGQVLSSTATGTNWVSSSGLSGSGTVGKVAKFTAGTTLGDGLLNDDGTSIWYNGPSPNDTKLAYGKDALSSGGGNYNTAIGFESQESNASGLYNTSLGFRTLKSLTTGNGNIAIGELALQDLTSGNQNICIGYIAGWKITTGTNNTAIGRIALQNNVTGNENTALGVASLRNTTSAFNTGIGSQALTANTTGVGNSALGQLTNSGNFSHSVILGREATATASNQFVVGSSTYNAGTVVTAPQTQTRYWEVVINGVTERILLA
jgi:hypothetical protein